MLKNPIRTSKSYDAIRRTEKQLLNKRVRSINNILYMCSISKDTCKNKLANILDKELLRECQEFVVRIRQARHLKTLSRQLHKFDQLQHKNNVGVCLYAIKYRNRDNNNIYNNNNVYSSNNYNNDGRNRDHTKHKCIINLSSTPSWQHRDCNWPGPQPCCSP